MDKIDLNKASVEDLEKIEGVGREAAEKIVQFREKKGKIHNFDELKQIRDIDRTMEEKIRRGSTLNM